MAGSNTQYEEKKAQNVAEGGVVFHIRVRKTPIDKVTFESYLESRECAQCVAGEDPCNSYCKTSRSSVFGKLAVAAANAPT